MRNNGEKYSSFQQTLLDFSIISRVPTQSNRTRSPVQLIYVGGEQYFNGVITELFWNWWPPRKSSRSDWWTNVATFRHTNLYLYVYTYMYMQTPSFCHSFLILPSFPFFRIYLAYFLLVCSFHLKNVKGKWILKWLELCSKIGLVRYIFS